MALSLLIFFVILAVGLAATLFVDLSWGISLYIFLYFIFPANRWWYTIPRFRYTLLVGIVVLICYLVKRENFKKQELINFPQIKWLAGMVVLMMIISFYAVWPEQHQKFLVVQMKQLIFLFLAYKIIDSMEKFQVLLWTYLAGNFYVGYLLYQVGRNQVGRVEGMGMPDGTDANMTAAVLITAIPILLAFFLKKKGWKRLLAIFLLVFIVNGVILLNSRGAFLGLIVAFLYFISAIFFAGKIVGYKERWGACFVLLAITCVSFLYLSDNVFWQRMHTMTEVSAGSAQGGTRTYFWQKSYELTKENPFGLGADGFEYLSPNFLPEEWMSKGTGTRAIHSTYFQALSDFGYPGIVLLAGFILSSVWLMRKVKMEIKRAENTEMYYLGTALESSFFAFLVAAAFINRLYAEVFYWLMLFMACFANLNRKAIAKQPEQLTFVVKKRNA